MSAVVSSARRLSLTDISLNVDPMFHGEYRQKKVHEDDWLSVLSRGQDLGVKRCILLAGSLDEAKEALELATNQISLFTTVGCHPTRCDNFDKYYDDITGSRGPEGYLSSLLTVAQRGISEGKVLAIGECGLDYDREHFCKRNVQKRYFERQFDLAERTRLPMFLHCRNSHADFIDIVQKNRAKFSTGVVHSFTGTKEEALSLCKLGLYIGLNGCSLKTQENLHVVESIPEDRILIGTDAPWCTVKPTHAGHRFLATAKTTEARELAALVSSAKKKEKWASGNLVKDRNEPGRLVEVLEIIAAVRKVDAYDLAERVAANTHACFFTSPSAFSN